MRSNTSDYRIHGICLIALFILGNTILTFPSGQDAKSGIYGLLVATLLALPLFVVYGKLLASKPLDLLRGKGGKILAAPLLLLIAFGSLMCCRDYSLFLDTMRLPNTSTLVVAGIFVALSFLLGLSLDKVLYLFSLVGSVLVVLVLTGILILSIPNMKWEYFSFALTPDTAAFRQGAGIFIHSFGQSILLVFFLKEGKGVSSRQYFGLGLGTALLGITFFGVLSVLGPAVSRMTYPYVTMGEMVKLGNGYSSMEGFCYLVYFICALIKNSLLLRVAMKIASVLGANFKKATLIFLPLVALLGISQWGGKIFLSKGFNLALLVVELAVPLTLLLKAELSAKKS